MIQKIKLSLLLSFVLLLVMVALTSFNEETKNIHTTDQKINQLISSWSRFYLTIESQDYKAYPPISSDQLFKINMAAYTAHKIASESYTLDCTDIYALLNHVYAMQIKNIYKNDFEILHQVKIQENLQQTIVSDKIKDISSLALSFTESLCNQPQVNTIKPKLTTTENKGVIKFDAMQGILPSWGQRNTLVVSKNSCKADIPYEGDTVSGIHKDALAIYSISQNLSKEKRWIAEFWSDDVRGLTYSPVSRWISIAIQMIHAENLEYSQSLELLAMLSTGLHDAAIICWYEKYFWNTARPEQYIQEHIDPSWQPFHETPNFPSYPSGHAVFGATASYILESFFGPQYKFTDKSHAQRSEFNGTERSFNNIKEMGIENAYSRLLMGVHFHEDCEAGLKLGYQIGDKLIKNYKITFENYFQNQMYTENCYSLL